MATIWLATEVGLLALDETGEEHSRDFAGEQVVAADAAAGRVCAGLTGRGVFRRGPGGDWEALGLADREIWSVADAGGGTVYVGVEPAALWRLGDGAAVPLDGLGAVDGSSDWHSPWGPADLSSIAVDHDRIVVGIEVGGVAVSHDRGVNWTARSEGLYEDVHSVVVDGDVLVATTGMGCFRSLDEGRNWRAESEGIDRGYTQGLTRAGDSYLVSAASGPPPMWQAGGPEAALFRATPGAGPLEWCLVCEGFAGNVGRHGLSAAGDLVVAGTTAGHLLVSKDGGQRFDPVRFSLPPIAAVAIVQ